jgi:hypothetical protein
MENAFTQMLKGPRLVYVNVEVNQLCKQVKKYGEVRYLKCVMQNITIMFRRRCGFIRLDTGSDRQTKYSTHSVIMQQPTAPQLLNRAYKNS